MLLAKVWVDDECGFGLWLSFQDLLCCRVRSVEGRGIDSRELVTFGGEIGATSVCLLGAGLEHSCVSAGRYAYVVTCRDIVNSE